MGKKGVEVNLSSASWVCSKQNKMFYAERVG